MKNYFFHNQNFIKFDAKNVSVHATKTKSLPKHKCPQKTLLMLHQTFNKSPFFIQIAHSIRILKNPHYHITIIYTKIYLIKSSAFMRIEKISQCQQHFKNIKACFSSRPSPKKTLNLTETQSRVKSLSRNPHWPRKSKTNKIFYFHIRITWSKNGKSEGKRDTHKKKIQQPHKKSIDLMFVSSQTILRSHKV